MSFDIQDSDGYASTRHSSGTRAFSGRTWKCSDSPTADDPLERLRALCRALPEVTERLGAAGRHVRLAAVAGAALLTGSETAFSPRASTTNGTATAMMAADARYDAGYPNTSAARPNPGWTTTPPAEDIKL